MFLKEISMRYIEFFTESFQNQINAFSPIGRFEELLCRKRKRFQQCLALAQVRLDTFAFRNILHDSNRTIGCTVFAKQFDCTISDPAYLSISRPYVIITFPRFGFTFARDLNG